MKDKLFFLPLFLIFNIYTNFHENLGYYKVWQVLQNVPIITKYGTTKPIVRKTKTYFSERGLTLKGLRVTNIFLVRTHFIGSDHIVKKIKGKRKKAFSIKNTKNDIMIVHV